MEWQWFDLEAPGPSFVVTAGVGAVTVMDNPNAAQRPYAFVISVDQTLWARGGDGQA